MRSLSTARLIFVLLLTTLSLPIYAWNALGHMVVADVAYLNLKPAAQKKVDSLVSKLNEEYPKMQMFLNIAYWPDSIRSQRIETYTHWHYIDNPIKADKTRVKQSLVDTDNAVWAVKTIKMVVRNDRANPYDRARFLSFLTHIVGDLHQPLHTVTYVSANHPNGDKGGNAYRVKYKGKSTGIHKLWDSGLGAFGGTSTTEHAMAISTHIRSVYPKEFFGDKVKDLDPDHWAAEGMETAKQYAYSTEEFKEISENYVTAGQKVAEQRAALAGYRLANLLNELLA